MVVHRLAQLLANLGDPPARALLAADELGDPARSASASADSEVLPWSIRFARAAACSPERRPKISVSSSELAPSRLPPWTETQATSPAA